MPTYDGILAIDKPAGFTSFDVVAKMRGIARTRKIGHAGTLDPMATGVLPLFLGVATKACDLLPRQDKRYLATFRLGQVTDTQDCTGKVLETRPVDCAPAQVVAAAAQFFGEILQLPPMYSALKVDGRKLCDLARAGIEVERQPRPVTIYEICCAPLDGGLYELEAHCSKGTYIRTLIHDIGQRLGCGAVMTSLRRTMAAGFTLSQCITLEEAERLAHAQALEERVLPVARAFDALPRVLLDELQTRMFQNGVRLDSGRIGPAPAGETLAVYAPGERFLGLARVDECELRLVRLFAR